MPCITLSSGKSVCFGNNEYRPGGKTYPPAYTTDPRKVQAYQDSVNLYNKTKDIQNPKYYTNGNPSWYKWKGNTKDLEEFMRKNNMDLDYDGKFPGKIQPTTTNYFGEGINYPIYKKPSQPYILEEPQRETLEPLQSREVPSLTSNFTMGPMSIDVPSTSQSSNEEYDNRKHSLRIPTIDINKRQVAPRGLSKNVVNPKNQYQRSIEFGSREVPIIDDYNLNNLMMKMGMEPKFNEGGKTGEWMGNKLDEQGFVTSTTKGGNRVSFTGNARSDEWINKQIDTGKFGYNPKTGTVVKLDKPVQGLSKEDKIKSTYEFGKFTVNGFPTREQEKEISKLPQETQDLINETNERKRRESLIRQNREMVQNPAFYAPGAAFFGGLAAPYIGAGLEAAMAALELPAVVGGTTLPILTGNNVLGLAGGIAGANMLGSDLDTGYYSSDAPLMDKVARGVETGLLGFGSPGMIRMMGKGLKAPFNLSKNIKGDPELTNLFNKYNSTPKGTPEHMELFNTINSKLKQKGLLVSTRPTYPLKDIEFIEASSIEPSMENSLFPEYWTEYTKPSVALDANQLPPPPSEIILPGAYGINPHTSELITSETLGPNAKAILNKSDSFEEFFKSVLKEIGEDPTSVSAGEIKHMKEIYSNYKSGATYNPPIIANPFKKPPIITKPKDSNSLDVAWFDYSKPLTDEQYEIWAEAMFKDDSHKVAVDELKNAHAKSMDFFNGKKAGSKEHGLYIKNQFVNRIPNFTSLKFGDVGSNYLMHSPEMEKFLIENPYDITKLSPQQRLLMESYAHGYDRYLNESLRDKHFFTAPEFYREQGNIFNEGILKNKFREPTVVRRGVGTDYHVELLDPVTHEPSGQIKMRSELKKGDVFKDESFLSTSIDPMRTWGQPHLSEIIEVPGGGVQSMGVPEAAFKTNFRGEKETILPKGLIREVIGDSESFSHPTARFKTRILNPYTLLPYLGGSYLGYKGLNYLPEIKEPVQRSGGKNTKTITLSTGKVVTIK